MMLRPGQRSVLIRDSGMRVRAFQPVEPVCAEQNEVNQQSQNEQETGQCNQCSPRIEEKPYSPHLYLLAQQGRYVVQVIKHRGLITTDAWEPRAPLPNQEVGNHCDTGKDQKRRDKEFVKLLGFVCGKSGTGLLFHSHSTTLHNSAFRP
jgi:hypothetical protein